MEAKDLTAAAMTVVLVAVGVVLGTVIMNRFGDLLSPVEAPEPRPNAV